MRLRSMLERRRVDALVCVAQAEVVGVRVAVVAVGVDVAVRAADAAAVELDRLAADGAALVHAAADGALALDARRRRVDARRAVARTLAYTLGALRANDERRAVR